MTDIISPHYCGLQRSAEGKSSKKERGLQESHKFVCVRVLLVKHMTHHDLALNEVMVLLVRVCFDDLDGHVGLQAHTVTQGPA